MIMMNNFFFSVYDFRECCFLFPTSSGGNYASKVFVSSICKDIFIARGGS